jgi:hypothetical protein
MHAQPLGHRLYERTHGLHESHISCQPALFHDIHCSSLQAPSSAGMAGGGRLFAPDSKAV